MVRCLGPPMRRTGPGGACHRPRRQVAAAAVPAPRAGVGNVIGRDADGEVPIRDNVRHGRGLGGRLGAQPVRQRRDTAQDARARDLAVEVVPREAVGRDGGAAGAVRCRCGRELRGAGCGLMQIQARSPRRLRDLQQPPRRIEATGDVVPGAFGQRHARFGRDRARRAHEARIGTAWPEAKRQHRPAAAAGQHGLFATPRQGRPDRRHQHQRRVAVAEVHRRHLDPGAEVHRLLDTLVLALDGAGHGHLAVARPRRVRVPAMDARDARAIPPAALHADHEAERAALADAPVLGIASDGQHPGQPRRMFQNNGRPLSMPFRSSRNAVGW